MIIMICRPSAALSAYQYMYFCNRYITVTGLLSTPAARIDKLAGGLDARGNEHCYRHLSAVTAIW
jgi:hypothetical protein